MAHIFCKSLSATHFLSLDNCQTSRLPLQCSLSGLLRCEGEKSVGDKRISKARPPSVTSGERTDWAGGIIQSPWKYTQHCQGSAGKISSGRKSYGNWKLKTVHMQRLIIETFKFCWCLLHCVWIHWVKSCRVALVVTNPHVLIQLLGKNLHFATTQFTLS